MNGCGATTPGASQVCTTWSMPWSRGVGGGHRVAHRVLRLEGALERHRGDAEVVEAVEQPVGERAVAGDDDAAAGDRTRHQTDHIR